MTPASLLRELERMTHDGRLRRMVDVGRLAATDASVARTLDALEHGGFYECSLTLQSCYGSRDAGRVVRALADPSRGVRAIAIGLVPMVCDDAQAQAAFDVTPRRDRRHLLTRLQSRGRWEAVDALLDRLAAEGDEDLATLLPLGSSATVARHTPQRPAGAPTARTTTVWCVGIPPSRSRC